MHLRKVFCFGKFKLSILFISWKWRYGVSSKVVGSDNHYLLFDIDTVDYVDFLLYFLKEHLDRYPYIRYNTPHGIHCIVLWGNSFVDTAKMLLEAPCVDKTWVAIGLKRGYWFLKPTIKLPKAFKVMRFMKIQSVI